MTERNSLQLALTGDAMITRHPFVGDDDATRSLVRLLRDADVTFGNLEILPNDFQGYPAQESGGTHLAAHSWVIDELRSAGFDLFSCATNHALDYSIAGLLTTISTLESKGVTFAGIGRNLAEARMPVYVERSGGTVAMISCCSSFAKGQQAGEQRADMPGRPGLNPLRYTTFYDVTPDQFETVKEIATSLGIEQQRLERIQMGFGFPPDDPEVFPLLDMNFRSANEPSIHTVPSEIDLQGTSIWVHEARARADIVVVSLHAHEPGTGKEDPAEFIQTFARYVIDEGADVVVGHGPHLLRGMEIYKGKPIFYSLGNFIAQNDLVYKLPADSYTRFKVDASKTPSEIARSRSQDGQRGFPADSRYWQTVIPVCKFESGSLVAITLKPVSLGFGEPTHRRGRPRFAAGDEAAQILARYAELSRTFGTAMELGDEGLRVTLDRSLA